MRDTIASVKNRVTEHFADLQEANRANAEAVNSLVVIGAVLFIGIFVLAMIGDAMPDDPPMFGETMDTVEGILESSFELAAILPIVLVAGALLFYVRGFGTNGRR